MGRAGVGFAASGGAVIAQKSVPLLTPLQGDFRSVPEPRAALVPRAALGFLAPRLRRAGTPQQHNSIISTSSRNPE